MSRNILSINGNKFMNYLLHTILSKDYHLICTQDSFQGMQELKKKSNIELILLDIDYDTEQSLQFIKHLHTSWLYQRPVIILTSTVDDEINARLIEANVLDIFTKPFNPQELVQSINDHMRSIYTSPLKSNILQP